MVEEWLVSRARSGDDANAEVFLELLEEDEGEHRVRNQADPCGHETLQHNMAVRSVCAVSPIARVNLHLNLVQNRYFITRDCKCR